MAASYLLTGSRTPIGKFLGGLASCPAPALAAAAAQETIRRAAIDPADIDEVILGNVVSAGLGQAPARQAALAAGIPPETPAFALNKVCGSGLKAVMLADQAIRAGDARLILAGGMESMSRAPHLLPGRGAGLRYGHARLLDSLLHDGLWCAAEDCSMGSIADWTAQTYGVSRTQQDAFALESHRRAIAAQTAGQIDAELAPIPSQGGKSSSPLIRDEGPRAECTAESLARLAPAFSESGTVTPGNASQLSDGAAALLVASAEVARAFAKQPLARIVATAVASGPPKQLFTAPVQAVERVLHKAGWRTMDVDLWEINEAFAVQALVCRDQLKIDPERFNIRGGAIALGHPLGASGARVLVTLLHSLAATGTRRGVAALCLGGGSAVAVAVERD